MLTVWTALALGALVAAEANAALLAVEDFQAYSPGDQLHGRGNGHGWGGTWSVPISARRPQVTIVPETLNYSGGEITVWGGGQAAQYVASEGSVQVLAARRAPTVADTVYVSLLYKTKDVGTAGTADFFQAGLSNDTGNAKVSAVDLGIPRRLYARSGTGGSVSTGIAPVDGQTHFLVVKATRPDSSSNYNQVSLFVDPTSKTEGTPSATHTADSGMNLETAANFILRKAFLDGGSETFLVDEVKIGTTYQSVVEDVAVIPTSIGSGADAYIESRYDNPATENQNFGSSTTLELKNNGNPASSWLYRKSYLRFDTSALGGHQTLDATLKLTPYGTDSSSQTFNLFGLLDGDAGESWAETGITWNNAPANDTADNDIDLSRATLLAQFAGGASGATIELGSSALLDFINADTDGLITLIVTRETYDPSFGGSQHRFRSREYGDSDDLFAPTLILVNNIPEPTSLALLALGGLAARLRRRRTH